VGNCLAVADSHARTLRALTGEKRYLYSAPMPASRRRTGGGAASSRRTAATGVPARRGSRSNPAATSTTIAPLRVRATGLLLRFISCGVISVTLGLVWRLTLAPKRIGVGSALLGVVILLSGFVVGGVLWYLRDA